MRILFSLAFASVAGLSPINGGQSAFGSPRIPPPRPYSESRQKFQYSFQDLLGTGNLASEATAINPSGWIVGWVTESDHVTRACIWMGANQRALGFPDGGGSARATKLNASGQIIGSVGFPAGDGTFQDRACTWSGLGFSPYALPVAEGVTTSKARDLNNAGQIVGSANGKACVWNGFTGSALEVPVGSTASEARAINASGVIAGDYTNTTGNQRACLWIEGTRTDLDFPVGAIKSSAIDINDAGQVLGWWEDVQLVAHLFRWENGTITEIFPPGLEPTGAEKNAKLLPGGSVIGQVALRGTYHNRAFVWKNGVATMLRMHGGAVSNAVAMSASGRIVGSRTGTNGKAQDVRLWPGGDSYYELNPSGAVRGYATDINDDETIIGAFEDRNGKSHAFVLKQGGRPKIVCNGINTWSSADGKSRNSTFNRHVRRYTTKGEVVFLKGLVYGTVKTMRYRLDSGPWFPARHLPHSADWTMWNTQLSRGRHVITLTATGREGSARPLKFTVIRR